MATIGPDPRSGPPGDRLAVDGPASHSAPVRWLLAPDPELDALTKAAKLAVVTCVALWLSVAVIGDPAVATFAASGPSRCCCSPTSPGTAAPDSVPTCC